MSKVLLAGTFDPITRGHEFLLDYASSHYDSVIIAIFQNVEKTNFFTKEARLHFLQILASKYNNVTVDISDGYTIDYALAHHVTTLLRGYRNEEDLAYERIVENFNLTHGNIPTDLIKTPDDLKDISSTKVREAILKGEDFSNLVPKVLVDPILSTLQNKNNSCGETKNQ